VQAWAIPVPQLACVAGKSITNNLPVVAKHAPMEPIAVSKMALRWRNWWPSMGFGTCVLGVYLGCTCVVLALSIS